MKHPKIYSELKKIERERDSDFEKRMHEHRIHDAIAHAKPSDRSRMEREFMNANTSYTPKKD